MRLKNRWWESWQYAVVAAVSGWLLAWFQAQPVFLDPDSFYHTRMVTLLWERGLVKTLPWLQFTTLAQSFTDHHLLYHVLLMPFTAVAGTVVGAKVFQALSGVVLALVLFHQLRRWQLPFALPAMLVLLSSPFLVRVQLVKASVLAIILFLLVLVSLLERRYLRAAIISVIYTFAHGGFILALVVAMIVWSAEMIAGSLERKRLFWPRPDGPLLVGAALLLGVMMSPYFPANLEFFWQQLVQIGLVNYQSVVAVGAEWYPYSPADFLGGLSIMLIAFSCAVAVAVVQRRQLIHDRRFISLGLLVLLLAAATLRTRRYVEYFVPVAWLFSCVVLLPYLASAKWRQLHQTLRRQFSWCYYILVIYFSIAIPISTGLAVQRAYRATATGIPLTKFQGASGWLEQHAPAGATVFHGVWDEFPMLFFHNIKQQYIVGLDATFMYLADRALYQRWQDISTGKLKQQSAHVIVDDFQARYVVIDRTRERTKLLQAYLLRDPNVAVVYEDDTSLVFKIIL